MGRSVDAGGPLWVGAPDDDGEGVSVDARFETLDVERRSVVLAVTTGERDDDDGSRYATSDPMRLLCLLDTGECIPDEEAANAFLADHPWFEERLQAHMDHLRQRAWRAVAQRDREAAARRALARATPGNMLAFDALFPADWDLLFGHGDALYWVVDQYCPNPSCPCASVALTLYQLRDGESAPTLIGRADVDLSRERPRLDINTKAACEIFTAFWEQHEDRLRTRRDEFRRAVLRYASPVADPAPTSSASRPPRNAPCPCGSSRKYKRCCLGVQSSSLEGSAAQRP